MAAFFFLFACARARVSVSECVWTVYVPEGWRASCGLKSVGFVLGLFIALDRPWLWWLACVAVLLFLHRIHACAGYMPVTLSPVFYNLYYSVPFQDLFHCSIIHHTLLINMVLVK